LIQRIAVCGSPGTHQKRCRSSSSCVAGAPDTEDLSHVDTPGSTLTSVAPTGTGTSPRIRAAAARAAAKFADAVGCEAAFASRASPKPKLKRAAPASEASHQGHGQLLADRKTTHSVQSTHGPGACHEDTVVPHPHRQSPEPLRLGGSPRSAPLTGLRQGGLSREGPANAGSSAGRGGRPGASLHAEADARVESTAPADDAGRAYVELGHDRIVDAVLLAFRTGCVAAASGVAGRHGTRAWRELVTRTALRTESAARMSRFGRGW
jgi:hypothetical protein